MDEQEQMVHPPAVIVGLGLSEGSASHARHNMGFWVVDALHQRLAGPDWTPVRQALVASTTWQGRAVVLAKPLIGMNNSGQAVAALVEHYRLAVADLCVVYDDLHLALGLLRFRRTGSAGGHKGMQSIIDHLGTMDVPRLRIGIGVPAGEEGDRAYVLHAFPPAAQALLAEVIPRAAEALKILAAAGLDTAMQRFNGQRP